MALITTAEQIGMQALAIPEELGGAGYGFDELAVILEEVGRTLFTGPVLPSVVLAPRFCSMARSASWVALTISSKSEASA